MIFDCLTPDEVRAKYERAEAGDKEYVIGVLADLTVSSREEVRLFLGVRKKARKKPVALDTTVAKRLYDIGYSDKQIAERLGTTRGAVTRWRNINGLMPVISGDIKKCDRMDLYEAGLIDSEIAKLTGVSRNCIFAWRKKRGLPPNGTRGGRRRKWKMDRV